MVLTYEAVKDTVQLWPAPQRAALVRDLLSTFVAQNQPPVSTLSQALGLLATTQPAPSDEEIAAILAERRREKFMAVAP